MDKLQIAIKFFHVHVENNDARLFTSIFRSHRSISEELLFAVNHIAKANDWCHYCLLSLQHLAEGIQYDF